MKRILILSVSAGAGHIRASEALRTTGESKWPDIEFKHVDIMSLVSSAFKKSYVGSYMKMAAAAPALWGYLYSKTDSKAADSLSNKIRLAVQRVNLGKVKKMIRAYDADAVICTHFFPVEIMAREVRKGYQTKPVWVVDTDFDVHAYWLHPGMTGYFAASDEVAFRMNERGVPAGDAHVSGIPIMPVFSQKYDRRECADELGIDPSRFTVLMMSGGMGTTGIDDLSRRALELVEDIQIVALAGNNKNLLDNLKTVSKEFPAGRLTPMPFTNTVERIMACSDIAVSKPGGLTSSECLAMGLPMIIVSPIPGQEERNADYLLEQGVAMKAIDAAGIAYRLRQILIDRKKLDAMRSAASRIARPNAAETILRTIINH